MSVGAWKGFSAPSELAAYLVNPSNRFSHITTWLEKCADDANGKLPDRVVNCASRLICGNNSRRDDLRRYILFKDSKSHEKTINRIFESIKPLRLDLVGHVYFVKSPLRPSNIKIGFTTRIPEVRVKSLMANSGEQLILLDWFVAVALAEQVFHCINGPTRATGEWFFRPKVLPALDGLIDVMAA